MSKSPSLSAESVKAMKAVHGLLKVCHSNLAKDRPLFAGLKKEDIALLQERYSRFSDERDDDGLLFESALNIHQPFTPRPYFLGFTNFSLNGEKYGTLWEQTGGGYSFFHVMRGGEITKNCASPYKPLNVGRNDLRLFLLREESEQGAYTGPEGDKVDVWPLFPLVRSGAAAYRNFLCCQKRSHLSVSAESRGIESSLGVTVPRGKTAEIWELRLRNASSRTRHLKLFVKLTWDLRTYPAPRLNRGEHYDVRSDKSGGTLAACNIDFSNKNKRTAFLTCSERFAGFDFSSSRFDAQTADGLIPQCVADGALLSRDSVPVGEELIGALQFDLSLRAGASKTLHFILGAVSGSLEDACKAAGALKKEFAGEKAFSALVRRNGEDWRALSSRLSVRTPDAEFDRFFNVWSNYQLLQTASFQSGASKTEFRERMQILSALAPYSPEDTRKLLKESLCFQLKDGRIINRFSGFTGDASDEEMSMDNAVWLVDAVCRYINETGDAAFLDETAGFFDPILKIVDTRKGVRVYDHVMAAVRCLFDYRGRFGLCKVGSRDCNPALVQLSKLGGISAWLSMALVRSAFQLFPLARLKNQKRDVGYLNTVVDNMYSNLNNYSWNGSHYTYAYDDNGNPIGNKTDKEGAVFLVANLWAVLCGAAKRGGNLDATLKIIDRMDTVFGHRSVFPPYHIGFNAKGGIPDLLPGTFENGAIDAFNRAYAVMAFAETGLGDKAYDTLKKGLPEATVPDISTANPNQISEFTIGPDHPDFGRNLYDIYNPAISWIKLAMERMTGVFPVFEGLLLSPCVPSRWEEFTVNKTYRNRLFSIRFHNPEKKSCGVKKVTVNGRELQKTENRHIIDPSKIPPGPKNKPVCVDVLMG